MILSFSMLSMRSELDVAILLRITLSSRLCARHSRIRTSEVLLLTITRLYSLTLPRRALRDTAFHLLTLSWGAPLPGWRVVSGEEEGEKPAQAREELREVSYC